MTNNIRRLAGAAALGLLMAFATHAHALSGAEMVARAMEWVDVGLLYCVAPNHAYDSVCGYTCNRTDNPLWDPYRSDCSGLVSWAWGLPPPGPSTAGFAPYDTAVSFKIDPNDLQPGDALNDRGQYGDKYHHHIILFAGWVGPNQARLIQESGCGKPANESAQLVEIVDDRVRIGNYLYHAIRSTSSESCEAHCEGTQVHAADCSVGDCAVYGATCTSDALGVRCVYTQCPAQGTVDACLDDNHIATCVDGLPTNVGDCSVYAAYCSLAGGSAHCASHFCADPSQQPVAHVGCFLDGSIMHCDDTGVITSTEECPAGTKCSVYPSPHCEADNGCPPAGDVRLCIDGVAAHCYEGTLGEAVDCAAQGRECVVVEGFASCTEDNPGDGDAGAAGTGGTSGSGGSAGSAGAAGGSAGVAGTAGQAPDAGSAGTAPENYWTSDDDSGCSMAPRPHSNSWVLGALLAIAVAFRRSRQQSQRASVSLRRITLA